MKIKKLLIIFIIIAVVISGLLMYSKTSNKKSGVKLVGYVLRVTNFSEEYTVHDITKEKVLIGKFNQGVATFGLNEGKHSLEITSNNRKKINLDVNSTDTKKEYSVVFEKVSPYIETFQSLEGESGGNVIAAKFFVNDTWAVGYVTESITNTTDYVIKIYRLENGRWISVIIGTALDANLLRSENVPEEVIRYVEGS